MRNSGHRVVGLPALVALCFAAACSTESSDGFGGGGGSGGGGGGGQFDSIAPTISISQPANNAVAPPGAVVIAGSAADNDALDRIEITVQGREPVVADGLDNWTYRSPELPSGAYVFVARAYDVSGNLGETQVLVLLQDGADDVEPPVLTVLEPAEGETLGAGPILVRGTASDNVEVAAVFAKLNLAGDNVRASGTTDWEVELDGSALNAGENIIVVSGRDRAGNNAPIVTRTISIDRTLPVAEITSGPAGQTTSDRAVFTIGGPNVATYSYSLDGGAFSAAQPITTPIEVSGLRDGEHRLEVIGISADSTQQPRPTVFVWTIDTTPPVVELSAVSSPTNQTSVSVTVSGDDLETYRYRLDGGAYTDAVSVTDPIVAGGLAEGAHTLEVLGSDRLGNEQRTPTTSSWIVDLTPPDPDTTTVSGAPGSITVDGDVSMTIGGPGIVEYFYTLDDGTLLGPFSVGEPLEIVDLPPGDYTITIFGVDAAGNRQEPPTVISFTVDPDAVAAVVSEPPAITNADSVTLTVSGARVASYEYVVIPPGGSPGSLVGPAPVSTPLVVDISGAEGLYEVRVTGIDSLDNRQPTPARVTFTADRTPPIAELANVPAQLTDQDFLNVSVGGNGVIAYRYQLDGGVLNGPFETSVPISATGISDGEHELLVFGIDAAGNAQVTASAHVWTVSTAGVIAELFGVPDPLTFETSATITVGGEGVEAYRHRLDGGVLQGPSDASVPITLNDLSNGQHVLEVFGIDQFGAVQADPTSATWTVDASSPVAVINNPPAPTTPDESFSFVVSGDGVVEYVYRLNNGAEQGPFAVGTTIDLGPLSSGSYRLELVGLNRAGLRQASPTVYQWLVSSAEPGVAVVSGIAPFSNLASQTGQVTGEDVVEYRWSLNGSAFSDATGIFTSLQVVAREGLNVLEVIGINSEGTEQATPTVVEFFVDLTPPELLSATVDIILEEQSIVLRFDGPIAQGTNQSGVAGNLLSNVVFGGGNYQLVVGSDRLTLTPTETWPFLFPPEAQTLTGFVQDAAGNQNSFELDLVVAAGAVYVDDDATDGNGEASNPFGTIAEAAQAAGPGEIVRVTEGVYGESIDLQEGVAISGGWNPTFTEQDPFAYPTVLAPSDPTAAPEGAPTGTVSCSGVSTALISGFEIRGAGGAGRAAVRVGSNCGPDVFFFGNRIIANTTTGVAYGVYVEGGSGATFGENEIRGGSGDGLSYAVYVEDSGPTFALVENVIDGWHGNPTSYGVYHAAGSGYIGENEIYGGTGARGGASGGARSCPESGSGESVGLVLNDDIVTEGNGVIGGFSAATGLCGLSGASTARGIVVNAVQSAFIANAALGGGGPASGCSSGTSVGLETGGGIYEFLLVDGGSACGGASDTTIGLRVRSGSDLVVANAVIGGGVRALATGVEAESGATIEVTNATFFDLSSSASSVAFRSVGATPVLTNDVFFGWATGVAEAGGSSAPSAIENNAFVCDVAYETSGGTLYTTVTEMEAALSVATGNVTGGVVFVDPDGADDDLLTFDDNVIQLSTQSSCNVREGGQSGVIASEQDIEGNPRTANPICAPSVANAGGWSMGAYELDL